jgi:hypothetical protein
MTHAMLDASLLTTRGTEIADLPAATASLDLFLANSNYRLACAETAVMRISVAVPIPSVSNLKFWARLHGRSGNLVIG